MAEGIEEVKVVGEPPMGVVTNNFNKENWVPKTELGFKVKSGEIKDINDIAGKGLKFLEPQIVDMLLPNLESSLLSIGQSKGKFGGGRKAYGDKHRKRPKKGINLILDALLLLEIKMAI